MTIQILNYITGEVIHEGDFKNIKEAVEDAVRKKISLSGADLWRANLSGADLSEANVNVTDCFGSNALTFADQDEIVAILKEAGAYVDSCLGNNALTFADQDEIKKNS